LAIARSKHPAGRFFAGDMSAFDLPGRYDAVLCLFSSIGYLRTLDEITSVLRCFRRHLEPGGIIIVEPWLAPGVIDPARVGRNVADANGTRIVRTSTIELDGRISRVLFEYEITDASGTRRAHEVHDLSLFTTDELQTAFREAELEARHDPVGLFMNRGLFLARVA